MSNEWQEITMHTTWAPEQLADKQRAMKRRWRSKMDDYLHMEPSKERTFLALQLWGSWSDEFRAEHDKEQREPTK